MFAAISVGMWSYNTGAGPFGALVVGLAVGVLTLVLGQMSFAMVRSPLARLGIGLIFAIPAAFAGYHAVHGITGMGVESESWRQALAAVGALFIGGAAWLRIAGGGAVVRRIKQSSPTIG